MDVDWRNNSSFATSSTDNMIYVCNVGEACPVKTFAGHQVCFLCDDHVLVPLPVNSVCFLAECNWHLDGALSIWSFLF